MVWVASTLFISILKSSRVSDHQEAKNARWPRKADIFLLITSAHTCELLGIEVCKWKINCYIGPTLGRLSFSLASKKPRENWIIYICLAFGHPVVCVNKLSWLLFILLLHSGVIYR